MKKLAVLVFIFAFIFEFGCFGQRQPIMPYGHYSPKQVERFAKEDSPKAKQFAAHLLLQTGESNVEDLFKKVYMKDTTLLAGTYQNSYWDVSTKKIVFFPGKEFTGEVTLYNNAVFELILYKDTCVNALIVEKKYLGLIKEDQPHTSGVTKFDWRNYKYQAPKKIITIKDPLPSPPPPVINVPKTSKFWTWQKRNWWWETAIIGTATGFVAHDSGHNWYLWFPKPVPHGTMSGGRAAITTTTTTNNNGGRGD